MHTRTTTDRKQEKEKPSVNSSRLQAVIQFRTTTLRCSSIISHLGQSKPGRVGQLVYPVAHIHGSPSPPSHTPVSSFEKQIPSTRPIYLGGSLLGTAAGMYLYGYYRAHQVPTTRPRSLLTSTWAQHGYGRPTIPPHVLGHG
ncbi:hypothetical protein LZ31DRAFT_220365 [Colletotrichum somersetense]|nr:hypothetical protein LZ31DRAFT_220365 [Colletotrichum somersetense]